MTSQRLKMLGVLLLVVVTLGGAGSYLVSYRQNGTQTMTVTPYMTTITATESIVKPSRPTEWITICQVRQVNYYLSLLERNGTQPYAQLANELRKLPDLTNATAVAKITYLALNATNPEVKEALELMIKGGTPDQRDFSYTVPNYNTELQVLYWLALQNEFKKDDTLALGIAMANGIWITMGEPKVVESVRRDTNGLLAYLREVDILQGMNGWYQLENFPLESKIAIGWTGQESMRHGYGPPISLVYWTERKDPDGNL